MNDRVSITLKFISIEFILYTFIKEFAKSYSFSSAKNYSSSVLNVYTSHL